MSEDDWFPEPDLRQGGRFDEDTEIANESTGDDDPDTVALAKEGAFSPSTEDCTSPHDTSSRSFAGPQLQASYSTLHSRSLDPECRTNGNSAPGSTLEAGDDSPGYIRSQRPLKQVVENPTAMPSILAEPALNNHEFAADRQDSA